MPLSIAHLSELEVPPLGLVEFAARCRLCDDRPAHQSSLAGRHRISAAQTPPSRPRCAAAWPRPACRYSTSKWSACRNRRSVADYRPMLEIGAAIGASRLCRRPATSVDFSVVAERMAEMCDLARDYEIAVDIEFMPFRPVKTFADAVEVVRMANRPNAHILVDALHVFRSNSSLDDIKRGRSEAARYLPDLRCAAQSAAPRSAGHRGAHEAAACRPWRPAIVVAHRRPAARHSGRRSSCRSPASFRTLMR